MNKILAALMLLSLAADAATAPPRYRAAPPLSLSPSGSFSIPRSTGAVDGYLHKDDFALFSAKAPAALVEEISGHIETASDKTYVLVEKARYARQVDKIAAKCGSGTITLALQIGGVNVATCNGIAVSTTASDTTCSTDASNDLASAGRLTLVASANSSCTDLTFTVQTTRD